jgi:hypothetical protein
MFISSMCFVDNALTHLFRVFHNSTPSASMNDVDSIAHLAETYSKP